MGQEGGDIGDLRTPALGVLSLTPPHPSSSTKGKADVRRASQMLVGNAFHLALTSHSQSAPTTTNAASNVNSLNIREASTGTVAPVSKSESVSRDAERDMQAARRASNMFISGALAGAVAGHQDKLAAVLKQRKIDDEKEAIALKEKQEEEKKEDEEKSYFARIRKYLW